MSCFAACVAVAVFLSLSASASVSLSNAAMRVEIDESDGALKSLVLNGDDGTASCAYYVPLFMSVTDGNGEDIGPAVRGECFDPWANDQDFGLYFMLRDWR